MEKKQRVLKGDRYWRIWAMDNRFEIRDSIDDYGDICNRMFEMGNYFHSEEEAKSVVKKFRAVLKGANVIEMPSKEEIEESMPELVTNDDFWAKLGWRKCYEYLKSKIVK